MTVVAGDVLIHNGDSGAPLPEHWTGICVDAGDASQFWLIRHDGNERSFDKLRATDFDTARAEATELRMQEGYRAVDEMLSVFQFPRQRG